MVLIVAREIERWHERFRQLLPARLFRPGGIVEFFRYYVFSATEATETEIFDFLVLKVGH